MRPDGAGRRSLGVRRCLGRPGARAALAANLSGQQPIVMEVELDRPNGGRHAFEPRRSRFETGRLYRLVLRDPHYFTPDGFAARKTVRGARGCAPRNRAAQPRASSRAGAP